MMGAVVGSFNSSTARRVLGNRGLGSLRLTIVIACSTTPGRPRRILRVLQRRLCHGREQVAGEPLRFEAPLHEPPCRASSTPLLLEISKNFMPAFFAIGSWWQFMRSRKLRMRIVTSPKLIFTGQGLRHFMHSVPVLAEILEFLEVQFREAAAGLAFVENRFRSADSWR